MRIYPLKTGEIFCNKGLTTTFNVDVGKMIYIPSTAWYIETSNHKIMVDTGMCDTERANKYHYKGAKQDPDQRIDRALAKIGINIEDIDIVILTHLHWDHSFNLHLFKNAKFYVQKDELAFAKNPVSPYWNSYDYNHNPSFLNTTFIELEGDQEILPGIRVIRTPGHSPGHQSVLVQGKEKVYAIAGDAIMCYQNLEGFPEKGHKFISIGRHADIIESWKSMEKIVNNSDFVLPGHEEKVFEKEFYE
tara:strand:+ start:4581 stop:5321 length:741 start_codon:yes stop_codon:yes gene_type:complete